ncbi:MAG: hypothetical protein NZM94_07225 [Roseiflexus sp.]|nr:hypothetical protein [Roseiflexus sp.]
MRVATIETGNAMLAEVTVTNIAREGAGCNTQVAPVAALAGQWCR